MHQLWTVLNAYKHWRCPELLKKIIYTYNIWTDEFQCAYDELSLHFPCCTSQEWTVLYHHDPHAQGTNYHACVPVTLIPPVIMRSVFIHHHFSNHYSSLSPLTPPRLLPTSGPLPLSVFLNVSQPFSPLSFILHSSCSSSFCPSLFLSLYRTPNVSSNGNPGYESLPLTDRQSPPPSVSSFVFVTSS